MYGLVTIWTSMDDGPYWVILLMYGSRDMRHRFPQVDGGQRVPQVLGCHNSGSRVELRDEFSSHK